MRMVMALHVSGEQTSAALRLRPRVRRVQQAVQHIHRLVGLVGPGATLGLGGARIPSRRVATGITLAADCICERSTPGLRA